MIGGRSDGQSRLSCCEPERYASLCRWNTRKNSVYPTRLRWRTHACRSLNIRSISISAHLSSRITSRRLLRSNRIPPPHDPRLGESQTGRRVSGRSSPASYICGVIIVTSVDGVEMSGEHSYALEGRSWEESDLIISGDSDECVELFDEKYIVNRINEWVHDMHHALFPVVPHLNRAIGGTGSAETTSKMDDSPDWLRVNVRDSPVVWVQRLHHWTKVVVVSLSSRMLIGWLTVVEGASITDERRRVEKTEFALEIVQNLRLEGTKFLLNEFDSMELCLCSHREALPRKHS